MTVSSLPRQSCHHGRVCPLLQVAQDHPSSCQHKARIQPDVSACKGTPEREG